MRITRKFFLMLGLLYLAACQGNAVSSPSEEPLVFNWDDRSIFESGLRPEYQVVLEELNRASTYFIQLNIPDEMDTLKGSLEVRYFNQEDVPLNEIYFRLYPNYNGGAIQVEGVSVDGEGAATATVSKKTALRVNLPEPLVQGESVMIKMDFSLEIPTEMGGNYGLFGYFDDILVLDEFYPVIAVYDENGWDIEYPSPKGDLTHLDASFFVVEVAAPDDLELVASGVEVSRVEGGGLQTITFVQGPARTFYLAASEDYRVRSTEVDGVTVNCYALQGDKEYQKFALDVAAEAIKIFNERFGLYPYTEFDIVTSPMMALGIEYPGITSINIKLFDPDEIVYGESSRVILESTVAHETGHQWFYNAVGNDQQEEPWVDEAITQYATYVYYLERYGLSAAKSFRDSFYWRWDLEKRKEIPIGLPAREYDENSYSAIVYGRGPLFVLALEEFIGEDVFNALMRDYYQNYLWEIATKADFYKMAEEHCECDLNEIFAKWVSP